MCVYRERNMLTSAPGLTEAQTRVQTHIHSAYLGTKRPDMSKHRHRVTPTTHGQTCIDVTGYIVDIHADTHTRAHSHAKTQTPGRHIQASSGSRRHVP